MLVSNAFRQFPVSPRKADGLFATVREERRSIRTLTVKVRYNDMAEDQAGESLPEPTDLETDVYSLLHTLLRKAWKRRVSLRLVALKLSNLYHGPLLTDLPILPSSQRHDSNARLAAQVDELRKLHGHAIILRGHDFRLRAPPTEAITMPAPQSHSPARRGVVAKSRGPSAYVPLRAHSHYSFLDSTLSPETIVNLAKQHGLPAFSRCNRIFSPIKRRYFGGPTTVHYQNSRPRGEAISYQL